MERYIRASILGIVFAWIPCGMVLAAEISVTNFTPELRYAAVDGSADKFSVHHWLSTGIDGGLGEFEASSEDIGNGYSMTTESHFFPGNADYLFDLELEKEDQGFLIFEFDQFRKYYSPFGGVHPQNGPLKVVDLGRDLHLDIGKLELELGLTPPDLPDLVFVYEYEYKRGIKSHLTWTAINQGGVNVKTGPSWQEIDENVHKFELKLSDDWNGLQWKADQKWEHFTNDLLREEQDRSVNATASENKVRNHILNPEADQFSSILELKKWFWKDKALGTMGYRYSQIENSEVETILEMNASKVPTTFANAHQVAPSKGTNQYGSHTAVASFFLAPSKDWTVGLKGKTEEIKKNGQSTLRNDNAGAAPDGNIDRYDVSNTDSRLLRFGEGVTLRYTGVPNLSLYNDVEFEQVDNDFVEDRTSSSAGEVFNRETLNNVSRGVEQVGFNYHPNAFLLWAGQFRLVKDIVDYDDQFETAPTTTGAKSAFFDAQDNSKTEVTTRATMNFCEWFSPTMRYLYRDHAFTSRFESADLDLTAETIYHIYTFDLPIKTVPELTLDASWQFQDVMTVTPANEQTPRNYAPFHGDVNTWMLSAGYLLRKDVSLNGFAQFQIADNVMDINSTGLPYGADYNKLDLEIGVDWRFKDGVTVNPSYNFYHFSPNENTEFGEYDAHVVWLGVKVDWA